MILEVLSALCGGILLGHLLTKYPKKSKKDIETEGGYGKNISVTIRDNEVVEEIVGEIKSNNDKDFDRLLALVSKEDHDTGRINLIKMSIKTGRKYTCDQVRFLIEEFDHDEYRGNLLILMYDSISDKENFMILLGAFEFSYHKERVMVTLQLI